MPPKVLKIPPPPRYKRVAEDSMVVEAPVADISDIGSSKKQRALEATDSFAKYTDRIKELEVNNSNVQCFVLYKHLIILILYQAQLASTQESLITALKLTSSEEGCDHCKKERMRHDRIQESEGDDYCDGKEENKDEVNESNHYFPPGAYYWSPPRMTVPSPLRRDVVISSQSEQDDAQEHPLISVMEGVTRSIETRVNTVGPSESVVISLRVTKVSG
jgi:hypothetical protein